jgi:hypothetical protein
MKYDFIIKCNLYNKINKKYQNYGKKLLLNRLPISFNIGLFEFYVNSII